MRTKSRIIFSTLLAILLVFSFSNAAFTGGKTPPPKKEGNTITYYREDGSVDKKEKFDQKGNLKWTTYYTADGTTDVYPDGRKEYRDIHGKLYLTIYYNKDGSISHTWDGNSKTIYHYNKDGTLSHLTKDGHEIMRFHYNKDGTITIYHTFYGKITFDKDGNVISCQDKRVKEKLKYDNESSGYLIGSGCVYKEEADGSRTYYSYDTKTKKMKKWYTKHRDGRVTWYDSDGNVEKVFYPATMYRIEGPGDKDIYGGNVKEIYYEEKKPPGVDKDKIQEEKLWYTKNKDGSRSYWRSPIPGGGVPLFVVHPDDSVTYYNQRGAWAEPGEILLSMWGCDKKYTKHPDGSKTYYDMNNEKSHTKHPDGSVTYYTDGKKGRNKYKTEHPDGSTTYYDDDGNLHSFRDADGNVAFYDKDGNLVRVEHTNGSVTYYKGGKKSYTEDFFGKKSYYYEELSKSQMFNLKFWDSPIYSYGRNWIEKGEKEDESDIFNKAPDMNVKTYTDEDGNVVTEQPDGTKEYTDKDGNKVTVSYDGSKRVCKKDGSCTYYDENGKRIAKHDPNGIFSIFKYEFGDELGKEVMKEFQYEVEINGSLVTIDGVEIGSFDTHTPNAGDEGETGSFDVGTPTPDVEDKGETGSFDVGTPTPKAPGDESIEDEESETSMEMEDDLFNEGLPPGMEPSDDGVPYEMIDSGIDGSGGMETIDLGVEIDGGSMTLE